MKYLRISENTDHGFLQEAVQAKRKSTKKYIDKETANILSAGRFLLICDELHTKGVKEAYEKAVAGKMDGTARQGQDE